MRPRLALLALLALAPLAACAGVRPPADGPYTRGEHGERDYYGRSDGAWSRDTRAAFPLRARLHMHAGQLNVDLNGRAHVAVFEISPGQGLGLMYPISRGYRSSLGAGFNRLPQNALDSYRWYYAGGVYGSTHGPRYYLLVASRSPLRLSYLQDEPAALRRHFGLARFTALNPRPLMDEVVDMVVPVQPDEDWDTDLLTVWPQEAPGLWDGDRLVRVFCDGRAVVVPVRYLGSACAFTATERRPQAPPVRPDTTGTPRDSVEVPTRRRPDPKNGDAPGIVRPDERPRVWTDHPEDGRPEGRRLQPRDRPLIQPQVDGERRGGGEGFQPRERPRVEEPTRGEPRARPGSLSRPGGDERPAPQPQPNVEPRAPETRPEPAPQPRVEPRETRPERPRPQPRTERPRPRAEPAPRVEPSAPAPSAGGTGGGERGSSGGREPRGVTG